ncbi:MAG TPA: hypothetical protein VG817_09480 [Gemmatimonadales bacterium]|nr:hypothetical protein [Gemmatimonadales bacterium]
MESATEPAPSSASWVAVAIGWALVGIPLLWGVYNTFKKAIVLFE